MTEKIKKKELIWIAWIASFRKHILPEQLNNKEENRAWIYIINLNKDTTDNQRTWIPEGFIWKGSINTSLLYFHICRVRWLSEFPFKLFFNITVALFVPCGGYKMSPRTFNQCCDQLRPLSTILMYYVNSTSIITFVEIFRPVYRWVVSISQTI
jgi:hypothetical protein